ncbi:MAG: OmpA family protein [Gammaproteobacteria bacterium]|jgi:peptidoglycan-associated lipoprotein
MNKPTQSSRLTLIAAIIATASLTSACSSTNVKPQQDRHPIAMTTSQSAPVILDATPAEHAEADMVEAVTTDGSAIEDVAPADILALDITTDADADNISAAEDNSRPARLTFHFGFNQTTLDEENRLVVEQHGRFLAEHPEIRLVINGHADGQGDSRYNQMLSQKRADHVADLLLSQGVMKEQIEIFSWGSTAPLADAQHNRDQRRVELNYQEEYWAQSTTE